MKDKIYQDIPEVSKEDLFSKKQLYMSQKFSNYKDIINAIFDDNKKYTLEEAQSLIQKFLKGDF